MVMRYKQYRLPNYDYSAEGDYFVTICTYNRVRYLGTIEDGKMILSENGKIVEEIWKDVPNRFKNIYLDEYQIMPDHFHGIIVIRNENPYEQSIRYENPVYFQSGIKNNPMELKSDTLGKIIRWFKGRTKFEISKLEIDFKWQARFYDRIIRNEREFYFITNYIINNPKNWRNKQLKKYFEDDLQIDKT